MGGHLHGVEARLAVVDLGREGGRRPRRQRDSGAVARHARDPQAVPPRGVDADARHHEEHLRARRQRHPRLRAGERPRVAARREARLDVTRVPAGALGGAEARGPFAERGIEANERRAVPAGERVPQAIRREPHRGGAIDGGSEARSDVARAGAERRHGRHRRRLRGGAEQVGDEVDHRAYRSPQGCVVVRTPGGSFVPMARASFVSSSKNMNALAP